jgi:hypothetical protein
MRIDSENFNLLNSSVSGQHDNSIHISSFWIDMGKLLLSKHRSNSIMPCIYCHCAGTSWPLACCDLGFDSHFDFDSGGESV